ncbi:MAG: FprA family A-type flavoprotein [Clostridiales Family XIII bacterium]|jgi:flavorubredoxin|nr:FprA family A-type flavoprotein [Clostridiales Family XIII bacterium]
MLTKQLTTDFFWVGNLDPDLRVFDIVMHTDHGTSYNSYILKGSEKTVLFDAAKEQFLDVYLAKLSEVVAIEDIDILVCNHTEPDHSGCIEKLLDINPNLQVVGSNGAINFLKEITNKDISGTVVREGDELDIGGKTLKFIMAPNLHWPDTMFTYIPEEKVLVTCDAFGAHYSYEGIVNDEYVDHEAFMKTALYYFDNIMGPFRADVRRAVEKIEGLDIEIIANGHGPVLVNNPMQMVKLYKEWSAQPPERPTKKVIIAYVSAYGYTLRLAKKIAEGIQSVGNIEVKLCDMVYADQAEVMNEIGSADGFLLGTPTVVCDALPPIWDIATRLNAKVHGGKFAGAFGSYGWSGEGVPNIMSRLSQLKLKIVGDGLRVRFKPSKDEKVVAYEYGQTFGNAVLSGKLPETPEVE